MLTASSRIWTQVNVSISYNDSRYIKSASLALFNELIQRHGHWEPLIFFLAETSTIYIWNIFKMVLLFFVLFFFLFWKKQSQISV